MPTTVSVFCPHRRCQLGFRKKVSNFCGIDTNSLEKYIHSFPDGIEVQANLYPVKYLGDFHVLMAEVWMPTRAAIYFKGKDPVALLALDKMMLLTASSSRKVQVSRRN